MKLTSEMIEEHDHCYLQGARLGGGLLETLAPLAQKALQTVAEKASQKAGDYLGEMATKGLIAKLLPKVKAQKLTRADKAFINELLSY